MRISDWSSDGCSSDLTLSPAGTKRDPSPALPAARNDEPVRACPQRGKHAGDRSTRRASVESRGNDDQKRLISVSPRRARGSPRRWSRCVHACGSAQRSCALRRAHPPRRWRRAHPASPRSEEHTSELQSLMRISYAVFCLKKKKDEQISKKDNTS